MIMGTDLQEEELELLQEIQKQKVITTDKVKDLLTKKHSKSILINKIEMML